MAYRLIWFQHFHKAAGTSIVHAARESGERFYPSHRNGIPQTAAGDQLFLWQHSDSELIEFVDQCESLGVTFVATEWGMPNVSLLARDPRVMLTTCIRQPYSRFISNFRYDLHYGFTTAASMADYLDEGCNVPETGAHYKTRSMSDYYCRMLSSRYNLGSQLDEPWFERARQTLRMFDLVDIVERGLVRFEELLGVSSIPQANTGKYDFKHLLRVTSIGRVDLAWRAIRHRLMSEQDFESRFIEKNQWDCKLYEFASNEFG